MVEPLCIRYFDASNFVKILNDIIVITLVLDEVLL